MQFGEPDRVPWLEEGLRDDVLEAWCQQGFPRGGDLAEMYGYDRRERIEPNLDPIDEKSVRVLTRADLPALRRRLDPDHPSRSPEDWAQCVERWRDRDYLLELPVQRGLFRSMGVNAWADLEPVLYLLADDPTLVRDAMDIHAALAASLADRVLREVDVDFVSFSEPIGGNDGPLVSPAMYRQIVLDSYRPIFDVLHRHQVETIVFMTYANARPLLDDVLAAGFNCLWAMETETEAMDYSALRRQYGRSLRLIGGIDLDCLLLNEAAIEREIMSKTPRLLADGGYIPVADGRVRANMPYHNYAHYRHILERVTKNR